MSRVNQIKKILRDHGVEMDADDILQALRTDPRYRTGLTRGQVLHSLTGLHASDPDIIRTRRGLYRYRDTTTNQPPLLAAADRPTPAAAIAPVPMPTRAPAPAPVPMAGHEPLLIIDLAHVRAELADELPTSMISDAALATHIAHLAARQLGTHPATTSCDGPPTVIAALVLALCHPAPILLATDHATTAAAQLLAGQVDRTVTVIQFPDRRAEPTPANPPAIPPPSRKEPTATVITARPAPGPTRSPILTPGPIAGATAARAAARPEPLDSLWRLDPTLYRRPVDKITGRGNTHALKRQALLVGETYAQRWDSVVNDDTRDRLTGLDDGLTVPDRLYGDLLTFAEDHGLPLHGSHLIKDHLRRGFWRHFHPDPQTAHPEHRAA